MSDEIATEKKNQEPGLLDLLLRSDAPDMLRQLPEKSFEVKRLSKIAGKPAVFRLRGLPYGRVQELRRLEEDVEVHIILAGCLDPDLRSPALMERYKAPTPAEAVKSLLLPGEIEDLSREIERLCGFRAWTIKEVKNG